MLEEAVNEALPRFYGQAVEENKVRPLGQPEVDVTDVPAEDGQDLKFTVEVDVRPELELPDYDALDRRGRRRRRRRDARRRGAPHRAAPALRHPRSASSAPPQTGDFVSIDLTAKIDDEEIDSVKGVSYEIGTGNMLDGLDEALVGMSAGETKTFTAPLAGGDREGQDADVTVTVQSVKERELPDAGRRLRPAGLASSTPSTSCGPTCASRPSRPSSFEQGVQARDKVLEHAARDHRRSPCPTRSSRPRCTRHLESEDRLEDDEHRAEVDESTRKALQRPVPARRDRREGGGQRSASPS